MKGRPSFLVAQTIGCFSASGWRCSKRGCSCSVATIGVLLSRENGRAKCSAKMSVAPVSVLVSTKVKLIVLAKSKPTKGAGSSPVAYLKGFGA